MSRTLATSRKSKQPPQSMRLWQEPLASRLVSKETAAAWMTLVVNWPFDSARFLGVLVRDGLSGKTSPACCVREKEKILPPSSRAWGNAGMGSPTEFWTLDISECPNGADVCLLSDIIETGDQPPQCSLTPSNIERMKSRLLKYTNDSNELYQVLCSDGPETKHLSTA
jgi:hypothetical protein